MPVTIEINSEEAGQPVDYSRLKRAARLVLKDAGIERGEISIAIVDDARMHALNRQYLQHDYPTDVLSFVLERDELTQSLEGEIIASADYAAREAPRYGWSADDELLLYIIHGSLHLVGLDDQTPEGQAEMRAVECKYLAQFGLKQRDA